MIDGYYYSNMEGFIISNNHRFKNIEILSKNINSLCNSNVLNVFNKVKHLSLFDQRVNECGLLRHN